MSDIGPKLKHESRVTEEMRLSGGRILRDGRSGTTRLNIEDDAEAMGTLGTEIAAMRSDADAVTPGRPSWTKPQTAAELNAPPTPAQRARQIEAMRRALVTLLDIVAVMALGAPPELTSTEAAIRRSTRELDGAFGPGVIDAHDESVWPPAGCFNVIACGVAKQCVAEVCPHKRAGMGGGS